MTILITGSSGKTARFLTQMLSSDRQAVLVASRSPKQDSSFPTVRFDWLQDETWGLPFAHEQAKQLPITAIYLVSPDNDEARGKVITFVKYALQRGVKRFVLLSAWENEEGGPLLGRTHAELKELGQEGVEWTVLRPHFFMENFLEGYHLDTIRAEGKIYSATTKDGRKPFISSRDIAAVARRTLVDEKPYNTDLIITGDESLSYDEVAAIFSEILGRTIEHVRLDRDEFRDFLVKYGMDEPMATYMTDLDIRVSKGEGKNPTSTVKMITGESPRTFKEYVVDNKTLWTK